MQVPSLIDEVFSIVPASLLEQEGVGLSCSCSSTLAASLSFLSLSCFSFSCSAFDLALSSLTFSSKLAIQNKDQYIIVRLVWYDLSLSHTHTHTHTHLQTHTHTCKHTHTHTHLHSATIRLSVILQLFSQHECTILHLSLGEVPFYLTHESIHKPDSLQAPKGNES